LRDRPYRQDKNRNENACNLPQRINDGLLEILEKYHEWGKREIAIVTHIEHPTEICPEVLEAVKKDKKTGDQYL